MPNARQIPAPLRVFLCALLCIGATLDDIDYINAIRAPRTMNGVRANGGMADDDSDDQHAHFFRAPLSPAVDWQAPFLSSLYTIQLLHPPAAAVAAAVTRSGRAPPPEASA